MDSTFFFHDWGLTRFSSRGNEFVKDVTTATVDGGERTSSAIRGNPSLLMVYENITLIPDFATT
jgi:hypothetical protein